MNHLDEGTIHAWIDGALDDDAARAAEGHVRECSRCAEAVAEARGLVAASSRILGALDEVPRNVIPKVAARARRPLWRAAPWVSGIAAALLAAVLLRAPGAPDGGASAPMMAAPEAASSEVVGATPMADTSAMASRSAPDRVAHAPTAPAERRRSVAAAPPAAAARRGAVGGGATAGAGAAAAPAPSASSPAAPREITITRGDALAQVATERARQDTRVRLRVQEEASRVAAAAPSSPPVSAMAPQASRLVDMSAVRPVDPLRDTTVPHVRLAGCYLVTIPARDAGDVSQLEKVARQKIATRADAAAAVAAAPTADDRAPNQLLVRLDTLAGRSGYLVRLARTDSSLGWWRTITPDSAQLDLVSAGVVNVSATQRMDCRERQE